MGLPNYDIFLGIDRSSDERAHLTNNLAQILLFFFFYLSEYRF